MSRSGMRFSRAKRDQRGFTLIELMITTAIFVVIAGAALTLFSRHQPIFKQQQNQAALNIAMRNAVAQMQVDLINGGAGYYTGVNIPNWPVGIVIGNNVVGSTDDCHSGTTYGASCFDSFTVITADTATTPVNLQASTSGVLPIAAGDTDTHTNTNTDQVIYVLPPTGVTAAAYAAHFAVNDQVLLVTADGAKYTTVKLTAAPDPTPTFGGLTYVKLTHSALTNADGTNSSTNDPTGMSVTSTQTTSQFAPQDWLVRLNPVQYSVDLTDPDNPTLERNGIALVNQVIGFKVGASLISGATTTDSYAFDSADYANDYTKIRSVMVSLVGRTPPRAPDVDPTYVFRNTFDGGPYQIQGVSVVINPRNMSTAEVGTQ